MNRFTMLGRVCLAFACLASLWGGGAYAAEGEESPNAAKTQATHALKRPTNFGLMLNTTILGAADFSPQLSSTTYAYGGSGYIYRTGGDNSAFWAPVHLPNGALLDELCVFYYNSEFDDSILVQWTAYGLGEAPFANVFQFFYLAPAGGYNVGCSSPNTTIRALTDLDEDGNEEWPAYVIIVYLGAGNTQQLGGVRLRWSYQLSPAPSTPTFNDVPPADFGFQYIEALVASGITGGTGGGNYSPDAFVTRRQMAIFIAKALGLYWPY